MNTAVVIILIVVLYVCSHAAMLYLYAVSDDFPIFFTLKDLYQHSKINAVGCLIIYLLLIVLVPVFTIGGIIKWLFTVGRRK